MPVRWRFPLLLGAMLMISACAAHRPVMYPNEKLEKAGQVGTDHDIDECMRLADDYVKSGGKAGNVARDTAVGGGAGAAIGAAGGAVYGNPGHGAAAGAATGATAGLLNGLFHLGDPNPLWQNYVNTCLGDRGYRVLGWD